ncbi:Pyridoxal phosphate-dependent transferases superfamily protein [Prunus dulcis]|uniref:Pyridoxal phosphate-dependent transferases superfamily protein n=1 Tax=Prunus dulcis TaxID=3755 RepID=A0A4Y1R7U9_PRUDU|nr:Pyridoxal phosphate-dependent transferases superfamily protein [Prunus dulcis]
MSVTQTEAKPRQLKERRSRPGNSQTESHQIHRHSWPSALVLLGFSPPPNPAPAHDSRVGSTPRSVSRPLSLILRFPPTSSASSAPRPGGTAATSRRTDRRRFVVEQQLQLRHSGSAVGYCRRCRATAARRIPVDPAKLSAGGDEVVFENDVQLEALPDLKEASFLSSDGVSRFMLFLCERLGRGIVTDAITTQWLTLLPTSFKKTADLIDFKEKRATSFEYGRYGNPTTVVVEEKISALEGAESTMILASGMCASTVMLMALVPAGGHIVTTTDCYRKTRIFIETILPKMGITATIIDPADVGALESALNEHKVSLFFTESPTNPFLRCVDIKLVSELCHKKGALVCIDGTFATPLNQKALALGADLVVHSATKYIGGHNDVLAGCISGSLKLVSEIRTLHHILGGALNPNAAYLIIRGMKTLHLRVQQQNSTASRMAKILEAHPKVARVYYPGLPSHPEHQLAKRQMTGLVVLSVLRDLSQSERITYGIKDNLVRFSFGVEDFEDLKADILQALETI